MVMAVTCNTGTGVACVGVYFTAQLPLSALLFSLLTLLLPVTWMTLDKSLSNLKTCTSF